MTVTEIHVERTNTLDLIESVARVHYMRQCRECGWVWELDPTPEFKVRDYVAEHLDPARRDHYCVWGCADCLDEMHIDCGHRCDGCREAVLEATLLAVQDRDEAVEVALDALRLHPPITPPCEVHRIR